MHSFFLLNWFVQFFNSRCFMPLTITSHLWYMILSCCVRIILPTNILLIKLNIKTSTKSRHSPVKIEIEGYSNSNNTQGAINWYACWEHDYHWNAERNHRSHMCKVLYLMPSFTIIDLKLRPMKIVLTSFFF